MTYIKTIFEIDFKEFLKQFPKDEFNRIFIPVKYIGEINKDDSISVTWTFQMLHSHAKYYNLFLFVSLCYNCENFIIKELTRMTEYEFYIKIDYGRREKYVDICYYINNSVSEEGVVSLHVSNNPYDLNALLFVIIKNTNERGKIIAYLNKLNIPIHRDKGLRDLIADMGQRNWNSRNFGHKQSKESFYKAYYSSFLIHSMEELKQKGYNIDKKSYKPKVFISYSWENKGLVYPIVETLENTLNLNIWIDKKSIDYGDNILESVLLGLKECDLALFFISNEYAKSVYGKQELSSIWHGILHGTKKWKIIRLNDVDPNDIFYSLGQIKYFDYQSEDINILYNNIVGTLKQIENHEV